MFSSTAVTSASLVPLGRFGALLFRERSRSGSTLSDLSRSTERRWLPDQLLDIERGRVALSDDDIAVLCAAYAVAAGPWQATAWRLVLDRSTSSDFSRPRRAGDPETAAVDLADRFLALAVLVGLDLTSERYGLDSLAEALDLSTADTLALLEQRLTERRDRLGPEADSLRSHVTVPSVGLLVGESPNGTLVLAPSPF